MKPIMYHYVRPEAPGLPHFPYLALDDFMAQLDWFSKNYGFVDRDGFSDWLEGGEPPHGVLLTFDDGLRDHVEFVLPVLRARDLWGLFYVPTAPLKEGTLLDVHQVHLALGRLGSNAALQWLKTNVPDILQLRKARKAVGYAGQNSDEDTKFIKQLFNWELSGEERRFALNGLLDYAFGGRSPEWREIYLDETGIRALVDAGMGVGAHSHRHEVASRLSESEQKREIALSCAFVENMGGSRMWGYCHPYGRMEAFTSHTETIVAETGCPFAFAVRAADIKTKLVTSSRYALPRHDCNAFPYGIASVSVHCVPARNVADSPAQL
jgi:peptidoglycan/xylan/chitin deacetylase (PgdA/CDA1 family)